MKKYLCEFIGTFFLVFAGTGAIVANDIHNGAIGHVGVALTFGLVVMAVIYAFGEKSGAHINPAVTLGFLVGQKISARESFFYILWQCFGALLASSFLHIVFIDHPHLGMTAPSVSIFGAVVYEFLLTFFLMLVVLSIVSGNEEKGLIAGVVIGGVVALEALFAGPITGASMNPARSLAPAVLSGQLQDLWIYIVAPVLGAISATFLLNFISSEPEPIPAEEKV